MGVIEPLNGEADGKVTVRWLGVGEKTGPVFSREKTIPDQKADGGGPLKGATAREALALERSSAIG